MADSRANEERETSEKQIDGKEKWRHQSNVMSVYKGTEKQINGKERQNPPPKGMSC